MKKLKDYVQEQHHRDEQPLQAGKKNAGKQSKKSAKYYMPITADRQTAIDEKIKTVQGSIFGRPVNKIEIGTIRDVWVPYGYFVYDYEVGSGKGLFKAKRSGQVHIIYDMNERHCMQYDEKESGALPLKKKDLSEDNRVFLKAAADHRSGILRDVEDYVHMYRLYVAVRLMGTGFYRYDTVCYHDGRSGSFVPGNLQVLRRFWRAVCTDGGDQS